MKGHSGIARYCFVSLDKILLLSNYWETCERTYDAGVLLALISSRPGPNTDQSVNKESAGLQHEAKCPTRV